MTQLAENRGLYPKYLKRLLDLVGSAIALIILSPLLGMAAILVRLTSRGPVFFVQDRLGLRGQPFRAFKLRTMTHRQRTTHKEILGDHIEVTTVGRFLRRTKIDELPQLANVLLGDMSLVGPRPALVQDLATYDAVARRRLEVRPGLTGLAQVNGNVYLPWPTRWKYDALYVENMTFLLDIKIIARTLRLLVVGEEKLLQHQNSERDDGKVIK